MARKDVYKFLNSDVKTKLKTSIVFKDYYTLAATLKNYVMTKPVFLELCETAINNDDLFALKTLLEVYYQLWRQDVFDYIIRYATSAKRFWVIVFIDGFIDRVNKYHSDVNLWNEYVSSQGDKHGVVAEKEEIPLKRKILNKIKEFLK